jgi:phytoene dehydrogenase-like protein
MSRMTEAGSYDVVIVGAGHNGLTCAGYLARTGLSVKVVERRGVVGGAAVSEEFHPGFRNSVCSYVVSLLNPKIIDDLELSRYGLEIMERDDTSVVPLSPDQALLFSGDHDKDRATVAALSPADVDAWDRVHDDIEACADVLREIALETPANLGGGMIDLLRAGKLANRVRKLTPELQHRLIKLMTMSVADFLSEYLDNSTLKAILAMQSFIGTYTSPYAQGSAYVLLHHFFGIVNGRKGAWGHARGGMGAITQAMARSAEAHGGEIEVDAPVANVLIESGVARGVVLEDGRVIRARAVAANTHPKLLFQRLVGKEHLDTGFAERIDNYRSHSATFRMNVALDELPRFTCLQHLSEEEEQKYLRGIVIFAQDLEYLEQAYIDARVTGRSKQPVMEIYVPSTLDDSLAPPGKHVMSLFCQHFLYDQPGGCYWDDIRETTADEIIEFVDRYAPNFRASVVGRQVLTPLDLEREFGLIGGDIFHGVLAQDQLYSLRPTFGFASYRMPVPNLYLCGSGAHPGGGVTGCPGHNAAREMIRDFRRRRLR